MKIRSSFEYETQKQNKLELEAMIYNTNELLAILSSCDYNTDDTKKRFIKLRDKHEERLKVVNKMISNYEKENTQ